MRYPIPGASGLAVPTLSLIALLAVLPGGAHARQGRDWGAPAGARRAIARWAEAQGPGWHAFVDGETGWACFLGGGAAPPAFAPIDDGESVELARMFVEETAHLTGLETATLVPRHVRLVPLSAIGTTDKLAVRFGQELGGVRVFDASVNVLLDLDGSVLSLQTTAMPRLSGTPTVALVPAEVARERAVAAFAADTGLPPTAVGQPELGIAQHVVAGRRFAALAWRLEVRWSDAGATPEGFAYSIDARDGSQLDRRPLVHFFDVGGTVTSNATPGTAPDTGSNPPQVFALPYLQVTSAAGVVLTDANGDFNFSGVDGPLDCTFEYVGSFADVDNEAGPEHVVVQALMGTNNVILLNSSPTELVTAQANAFREIAVLRDWIRAVDPSDGTADFQALANCNLNQNCNAYWNGSSVNFFTSGGSCVNTAYSTVVAHEMGHWLNQLYETGNGSDGMGEGNADVFAMYLYDTPIVGEGFFGPGTNVRSGWNGRAFCGDCNPGCAGEVHADGEVWMGAAWKIRDHLNNTNGDALGDAIADALFSAWMNVYDQRDIRTVIETQWLTLDDDNGNIDDGTPHFADVDQGFRDQGFPGFDLPDIVFTNVSDLPDTSDETGPYTVDATVVGVVNPPLSAVELVQRVNGGPWVTTSMTHLGGDDYTADIPGQARGSDVDYYLSATDGAGSTEVFPRSGEERPFEFFVGIVVLFFDDFEGNGNNGWTHGTNGGFDDWQHDVTHCAGGDPTQAFSGSEARGNDLGRAGFDGFYEPDTHNWLRSPYVDCSAAVGTRLRFRRWLTLERHDVARIAVNGQTVWKSEAPADTVDTSWQEIDLDISDRADGVGAVKIEFSLQSDSVIELGGWTIDDFALVHTEYDCPTPVNYGQAKTNSAGGIPTMGADGVPSASLTNFEITLTDGIANQLAILLSSDAPDNTPFLGGFRLVLPPVTRVAVHTLDLFGDGNVPIAVLPGMAGTTLYYQNWYRDPAHPDGTQAGLSDGLEVTYCE